MRDVVAAMGIAQESFRAIAIPFDRAPDLPPRPDADRLFGIDEDFRAEAAADIRRDHTELMFRRKSDERRQNKPRDMRVLARRVKEERVGALLVFADGGAWLHRVRYETVVDQFKFGHVLRRGERLICRRFV